DAAPGSAAAARRGRDRRPVGAAPGALMRRDRPLLPAHHTTGDLVIRAALLVSVWLLAGCESIPGMRNSERCADTEGNGPRDAPDFIGLPVPGFAGLTPEEAFVPATHGGVV